MATLTDSKGAITAPIIEFRDVGKSFGTFKVLDGLNFIVRPSEHLALIGPSGSGKTTILRILMTLESVTSGHVLINGVPLNREQRGDHEVEATEAHLRRMRADVGMVFQHFNLFPHKTALENVSLAPVLTGRMSRSDAQAQAHDLLEKVGLAAKADEYPARLSGGQKQRVAIARALALQPKILLLDEITSALDPELVEEVLAVIADLRRNTSITMLLVTHEMSFARDFADRVLFFEKGQIVEEGPPENIFRTPKHERTQVFLKKILAAGQRV